VKFPDVGQSAIAPRKAPRLLGLLFWVTINITCNTRESCYTVVVSSRLRNVTVTLEEDVALWARIEAARQDLSVSRLLGQILKDRMTAEGKLPAEAAERLATFGKRHRLSLRGLRIKDLINEGRR
jgi:hypothetical protein